MSAFTFRTLCECTSHEVAAAFRTIFDDFALPAPRHFDGPAFERRYSFEHLDRAASIVVTHGGAPAATILVARRGRISHISGLGVAAEFRRKGLARTLLLMVCDAAAERGDSKLLVEVATSNTAARSLYESLDFVTRRELVGYSGPLPTATAPASVDEIDIWSIVRLIALHGPSDLPWFFHPSSLAGCSLPTRAYQRDGAYAIVTARGTDLHLRALFVDPDVRRQGLARRLLTSLADFYAIRTATVLPFVPLGMCDDFFSAMGMSRSPMKHVEMERWL